MHACDLFPWLFCLCDSFPSSDSMSVTHFWDFCVTHFWDFFVTHVCNSYLWLILWPVLSPPLWLIPVTHVYDPSVTHSCNTNLWHKPVTFLWFIPVTHICDLSLWLIPVAQIHDFSMPLLCDAPWLHNYQKRKLCIIFSWHQQYTTHMILQLTTVKKAGLTEKILVFFCYFSFFSIRTEP